MESIAQQPNNSEVAPSGYSVPLSLYENHETDFSLRARTNINGDTNATIVIYHAHEYHLESIVISYTGDVTSFIDSITSAIHDQLLSFDTDVPAEIIVEATGNLIHAAFKDVTITICDEGRTVILSDHGPGIDDKNVAKRPGFSSATQYHKKYIRGVGSGFSILRTYLGENNGTLALEDNIGGGTVLTIKLPVKAVDKRECQSSSESNLQNAAFEKFDSAPYLTERQREVLVVTADLEEVGPSTISELLGIALSTAYRDLIFLEKCGLIEPRQKGKRAIAQDGYNYLKLKI
ncbi:MAG: hypothetical protein JJE36_01995 [Coriobacteriia bacterium]|nr:hypothetical protein [Coriobacteriia bacterium]